MNIYDPLSLALGLEPQENPTYLQDDNIPNQYDPNWCRKDAIARNKIEYTCNKCGVIGKGPNMIRWHFDYCQTVLRDCKQCGKTIPRQGTKDYLYNKKIFCNRQCYMKSKKGNAPIIMTDNIKNKLKEKALSRSDDLSIRMKNNKVWLKSNRWKK
jgi:hypothetical protein